MLHEALRWAGRMSLRWFYRDVTVEGTAHVPRDVPVLIVANHPNQLVDALLVGTSLPRDVTYTGKAILLDNPAMAWFLGQLPFVPLRRAHDERKRLQAARGGAPHSEDATASRVEPHRVSAGVITAAPDPQRNAEAFRAIHDALARREAVLIFPEGISHHQPQLAPIKTGAARIALSGRDARGIAGLHILPVGLNFERKDEPRTRVLVRIGAPIALDGWRPPAAAAGGAPTAVTPMAMVDALTREVDAALRAVTLNFEEEADRARVVQAAGLLAGLFAPARPLGAVDQALSGEHDLARRLEDARRRAADAPPAVGARVERFAARLEALGAALVRHDVPVTDVAISTGSGPGAWFVVREGARALLGAPLALWGRLNHEIPLRLARVLAARTSRTPEDPAMHTIVAGLATVVLFYLLQAGLVWWLAGPWWALAYLVTLPPSATWDLRVRDHVARARRRMRAYRLLRRDPALHDRLRAEVAWLREEAPALESALSSQAPVMSSGIA